MDTPRADSVGGVPQGPHEVLIRVHQCALCSPAVLSQRFCFHMRRWLSMIADSTRREDRTG